MPGVVQHSQESLIKAAAEAVEGGVGGLMIFGVPERDEGRSGRAPTTRRRAERRLRLDAELGDATVLMADLCLDEFTDHGHCGVSTSGRRVDNDATLHRYAAMALAQAEAVRTCSAPAG